jgi:arsenate reductase (thioredoxin)
VSSRLVVFACVHSAGRSQMAAAFFNELAGNDARAVSAGTSPGARVHPVVIEAMNEAGIDLSTARPRLLTEELASDAAMLITMGCGEQCPVVRGVRREDWPLEDPKDQPIEKVRKVRDEIRQRVRGLIAEKRWTTPRPTPSA